MTDSPARSSTDNVLAYSQGYQTAKPRIVQFRSRRYSVRLEPVFWQALERLAERANLRLGQYVANLAEGFTGSNFSSYLRVVCMLEAERALAGQAVTAAGPGLTELIAAAPTPGLILSRHRSIVDFNRPFAEWLGPTDAKIRGAELTDVLQVRTRPALNELWAEMRAGRTMRADAKILHVAPGRASAAQAVLVALRGHESGEFHAVMWLSTAAIRTAGRIRLTQPLPHDSAARGDS